MARFKIIIFRIHFGETYKEEIQNVVKLIDENFTNNVNNNNKMHIFILIQNQYSTQN
jgi:hypothetical protein